MPKTTGPGPHAWAHPVDVTPEEAFDVYASMDTPSQAGCTRILNERGHKVSIKTIGKWANRHDWQHRVERAKAAFLDPTGKDSDLCRILQLEAEWMTPELLKGLQQRIVARMASQIKLLDLDATDDYGKLVDVLDRMDAIIHRHRGEGISEKGGGRSPINLAEFQTFRQQVLESKKGTVQ